MPSFYSRQINFTTGTEKSINFTSLGIGSHAKNIRRVVNIRVIKKCACLINKVV